MQYRIPPKVATINSFAGYGRCSTTEVLPILSAMRVQACPVPTAIFSNHTGFPSHYCQDFTDQLPAYLAEWEKLNLVFDGVYCGFLGQPEQIPLVAGFIKSQREKGFPVILVDPVMGDHGKSYKTITAGYSESIKELVALADIITPNITEACLLTGTHYKESGWQQEELETLCAKLHSFGPQKVAVTGLRQRSPQGYYDSFINFISEKLPQCGSYVTACNVSHTAGPSRHGTGDIFASILAADAVMGQSFSYSVEKAASFISTCIHASDELGIPESDGVCFENFLNLLMYDQEESKTLQ